MSELRRYIEADYREWLSLNKNDMPDGLARALKSHERVPSLFRNLEEQIAKSKVTPDRMLVKEIVYDFTAMFVKSVKLYAEEKAMSEAAKQAKIKAHEEELSKKESFDAFYKENEPEVETHGD